MLVFDNWERKLLLSRRKKITTFSIFATKKISKKEDISVWQELDTKERGRRAVPFFFFFKKTFVRLPGRRFPTIK